MEERRFWGRRRRKPKGKTKRAFQYVSLFVIALLVSITAAPELLAWPYHSRLGSTEVYSERPIPSEMEQILARSDRLLSRSPLRASLEKRSVFLTDGGWRWNLLALGSRNAFALRRPLRDSVIVNRSDVAADRIEKDGDVAGVRSLSGTLAHEFTHILVARRYGEVRAMMLPRWKSEGFADHVAQESSLSAREYRELASAGESHSAMAYFDARRQVAAVLRRSNGDPDALFD